MQHRRETVINQAVLIPIAGNYDKKPRSLDREVTAIGRARGADLCLEANEISTLHCMIYRTPEGFRIRDCNSRCGTRINGESVRSAILHDADIVNIGPFSFEFRVPTTLFPKDGMRLDPVKVDHWRKSRQKLARFALKFRKRLAGQSPHEQEWAQKAHLLKEKIRCYDQRLGDLEEAEKELSEERSQLAREREAHQKRVQAVEGDLAARLAQTDEEIHARWQEFQKRCKAEEGKLQKMAESAGVPSAEGHPGTEPATNEQRERLRQLESQLRRHEEQLERERQEFQTMKEQWVQDQSKSAATAEERRSDLSQQEASLRAQRTELLRMMGDLKRMQEDLRKQARPDVRALQDEVERLAVENQQLRAELQSAPPPVHAEDIGAKIEDLRAEIELLHEELKLKDEQLHLLAETSPDVEALRAENHLLKQLLEEKDAETPMAAAAPAGAPKTDGDLERYEAELNEFRRQLEADRSKIKAEVEVLRERNKELDEAVREMEMEMSKERAELARERIRLERLREEVKADMERMQREASVRDSLAPVQKLRDEINGKQAPAKAEKPLNDRLRSLRNQLTDSHPSS
mgnify:CR=1 FL=1